MQIALLIISFVFNKSVISCEVMYFNKRFCENESMDKAQIWSDDLLMSKLLFECKIVSHGCVISS